MRNHRGYLLPELMIVLGLVVVAGSLAIHLTHWSLGYLSATQIADSRNAALDQCVAQLRRDVWKASEIATPDATTLLLDAGIDPITWQFAADGLVTRTQAKQSQTWEAGAAGASITIDHATVEMTFPDTPESRGGSLTLISQAKLLLGANQP
jgi:type II secretory pathway pseudopilin PulG